jgi:hypothetical protein
MPPLSPNSPQKVPVSDFGVLVEGTNEMGPSADQQTRNYTTKPRRNATLTSGDAFSDAFGAPECDVRGQESIQ